MYIVREIFTAKPGNAGKLAKMFRETMAKGSKARVLTDMVGPYHTVIMETEVASLAEWEKQMQDYKAGKPDPNMDPEAMKKMASMNVNEMYISGRREIFQVIE